MALHAIHVDLVQEVLEGIRAAEGKMREGAEEFTALVSRLQAFTGSGTGARGRRGRPPGRGARSIGGKRAGGKRGPQKGSLPWRILAYLKAHSGHHSSAGLLEALRLPQ